MGNMGSAHPLVEVNVSCKFKGNPSISKGVIERTRIGDGRTDRPTDRPTDATKRIQYSPPHILWWGYKNQYRIENLIDSTKPDIIIATEKWLDPSITDNQVFPDNFKLWRNDRKTGTGVGELIAAMNSILSTDIPELQTETVCEIVWAKVNIVGTKASLFC